MLAYLKIENIAVIESAEIEFYDGLSVLTGETGAGKSIIIDAIGMVLGQRVTRDMIRTGKQKATVSGLFYLQEAAWEKLTELDLERPEDDSLLLSRELSVDGRGVCKVNGLPVPLSLLKEIGKQLINIHGQQDTAVLYSAEKHIGLLDSWAEKDLQGPLKEYETLYTQYKKLETEHRTLTQNQQQRAREIDILEFQIGELSALHLKENEEEELEGRISAMENGERINEVLTSVHRQLIQDSESARDRLHICARDLEGIAQFAPELDTLCAEISDIAYRVDDIGAELDDFKDRMEYDEHELDRLNDRLYEIKRICTKYRCGSQQLMEFESNAREKLSGLQESSEKLGQVEKELKRLDGLLRHAAKGLHQIREREAAVFAKEMERQLADLNMPGAMFTVRFETTERYAPNGTDQVEFLISPNPGEEVKPLAKIASGGELSRIMLSLKSIISAYDTVETYIFDEIDTGISGRTAEKVAEKLRKVALSNQTLIITHSPHIAAIADRHYLIQKAVTGGVTKTSLKLLDHKGRIEEIARINSGSHISDTAIAQAAELLKEWSEKEQKE